MNSDAHVEPNCPFCRSNMLIKGEILAESKNAYLIQNYFSPGNYLIIPYEHIESPLVLPDSWWHEVKNLLVEIPKSSSSDYNISLNFGKNAGQSIAHLHFWVVPRESGKLSSGKGLARLLEEIDESSGSSKS